MQLTNFRSKEKDYDIYLKSEKLVNSQQEHEQNVPQLFGSGKKVDPCCLETKNCSSQLLEARKKIMTSI